MQASEARLHKPTQCTHQRLAQARVQDTSAHRSCFICGAVRRNGAGLCNSLRAVVQRARARRQIPPTLRGHEATVSTGADSREDLLKLKMQGSQTRQSLRRVMTVQAQASACASCHSQQCCPLVCKKQTGSSHVPRSTGCQRCPRPAGYPPCNHHPVAAPAPARPAPQPLSHATPYAQTVRSIPLFPGWKPQRKAATMHLL